MAGAGNGGAGGTDPEPGPLSGAQGGGRPGPPIPSGRGATVAVRNGPAAPLTPSASPDPGSVPAPTLPASNRTDRCAPRCRANASSKGAPDSRAVRRADLDRDRRFSPDAPLDGCTAYTYRAEREVYAVHPCVGETG